MKVIRKYHNGKIIDSHGNDQVRFRYKNGAILYKGQRMDTVGYRDGEIVNKANGSVLPGRLKYHNGEIILTETAQPEKPKPRNYDVSYAILEALNQPLEHDKHRYIYLGSLAPIKMPEAVDSAVWEWKQRRPDDTFYTYKDFLHGVSQARQWEAKVRAYEYSLGTNDERYRRELLDYEQKKLDAEEDYEFRCAQAQQQYDERLARWSASASELPPPQPSMVRPPKKLYVPLPPQVPLDPVVEHERDFIRMFQREFHTPDRAGYAQYLLDDAPEGLREQLETPIPMYANPKERLMHTYFLADTGSGKSEYLKLLIHETMRLNDSAIVVLDPNSDFSRQIGMWKEFSGIDRLVYLDYVLKEGVAPIINPFQIHGIKADDFSPKAMQVKTVFVQELAAAFEGIISSSSMSGDSFSSANMELILKQCITVLVNRPGSTIEDLHRFMKDHGNHDLMSDARGLLHPDLRHTREFFTDEFMSTPSYKVTRHAIRTRLQGLLTGAFQEMTCGDTTVWLDELVKQKKIIVCNLGKGSMSGFDGPAFGRMVLSLLQGIAQRNAKEIPREEDRHLCHVIVDECHNFICPTVQDILLEARKYRLILTMCQQVQGYGMSKALADIVSSQPHMRIVGKASPKSVKSFAEFAGVDSAGYDLEKGDFYILAGKLKVRAHHDRTELLSTNNNIHRFGWALNKQFQIKKYYTDETHTEYITEAEFEDDYILVDNENEVPSEFFDTGLIKKERKSGQRPKRPPPELGDEDVDYHIGGE